ncbi:DUF1178 family protein [Acidovorax sp. NCPPB 3859]|nr:MULTISPECIES: DUF1178 family protein [unclassified Acidovorax]MDA8448884.1 DUF1178 family protein [Acidovorax sp. GBBC 3297]MDA8457997.1 DUF1178 family protein [Acidovorax sp. GBBC 3333]MDA8463035.1 DUF1178 family protein [Acidovorax sp. GBBC 3332]MDA8468360.1 DUF1178 family protein [Acidovorax sp. GBBC 3299]WCM79959.1 DUF1178 family protein [Acidovorax sp. GBBC 712]
MKVLDLHCALDHAFEGWFASEADFQDQLARGLVECPLCGNRAIRKVLSAPRLNLKSSAGAAVAVPGAAGKADQAMPSGPSAPGGAGPTPQSLQAAWLRLARHVMAHTEDVGSRFAQEARRIHEGDAEDRPIRGQASVQETVQLLEEGIAVLPLPLPASAKETLQ